MWCTIHQWLTTVSPEFTVIGGLITLIGFIITLYQLFTVKDKLKSVENATKIKIQNTVNLVMIIETISQIRSLQDSLKYKEWDSAAYKMSDIHVKLSDIASFDNLHNIVRYDFSQLRSRIPSDLSNLRRYKDQKPTMYDVEIINKNLDSIIENLKLVEQYLKK